MPKLLVVEDDPGICRSVKESLTNAGYTVETAQTGDEGLFLASNYSYDLLVLDWNLPGKTGLELLQELRAKGKSARVIMLTAHTATDDKLSAFGAGVDDYLSKPFEMAELLVRVQAILRRPEPILQEILSANRLELNLSSGKVVCSGHEVKLQPIELSILTLLMKHPGQIFSTKHLLDNCWKSCSDSTEGVIRYHINGLRKKIDHQGLSGSYIETLHGLGYRFVADGSAKKPAR